MSDNDFLHEGNASEFAREAEAAGVGLLERQGDMGSLLCAKPLPDVLPLIPQSEVLDRIKQMDAEGGWVNDRRRALARRLGRSIIKNQGSLGYCHLFALASSTEAVRDRQGEEYVELAPESLGGVVGWRNQGGSMDVDIEYAAKTGIAPREFCPPLVHSPGGFKSGWDAAAKKYAPTQWVELGHEDMWRETMTALLLGYPVYAGWSRLRHSMMVGKLVVVGGEVCAEVENSWGPNSSWGSGGYVVLRGSTKIPTASYGCFAPVQVTWGTDE